ncbi:hypothetical protein V7S57_02220 [Caulobacter sp. CCNWLY153]|uniref:hypothetical protein n=1 Tax=unclassified Caulobacter TaxID=2648921 RepID=UPI002FEF9C8A
MAQQAPQTPQTPLEARDRILQALSAAGAAVSGLSEFLRPHEGQDPDRSLQALLDLAAAGGSPTFEPLGEEAIEPLSAALALAIEAGGVDHRHGQLYAALTRYRDGDA